MAYKLKVDGSTEPCGTSLKELQEAVGGLIEIIDARDGSLIICNEDGKLMDLPVNKLATDLYVNGDYDVIVGDVVIAEQNEIE